MITAKATMGAKRQSDYGRNSPKRNREIALEMQESDWKLTREEVLSVST